MKVLIVAKAPVAGEVKTRLGAVIGAERAAELAAAALLWTSAFLWAYHGSDRDVRHDERAPEFARTFAPPPRR